jgi:hypothetical protein
LVGKVGERLLGDEEIRQEAALHATPLTRLTSSRKALKELRDYLLNYQTQHPHEEIYIEISEPDKHPLYDVPYDRQLQNL